MSDVATTLQALRLHPGADHFTVALLTTAVVMDLAASLFGSRSWMRYMALTLMIFGAGLAAFSMYTGKLEARRVFEHLGPDAKEVLHRHALMGEYLTYVFAGLALWRIGIEAAGFINRSRTIYLLICVATVGVLLWQAHLGGELVYQYGVGTAPLEAAWQTTPSGAGATSMRSSEGASALTPSGSVPSPASATPSATVSPTPRVSAAKPSAAPTKSIPAPTSPAPEASPSAAAAAGSAAGSEAGRAESGAVEEIPRAETSSAPTPAPSPDPDDGSKSGPSSMANPSEASD